MGWSLTQSFAREIGSRTHGSLEFSSLLTVVHKITLCPWLEGMQWTLHSLECHLKLNTSCVHMDTNHKHWVKLQVQAILVIPIHVGKHFPHIHMLWRKQYWLPTFYVDS